MNTKPQIQKVVFRAERRKDAQVTAVLLGQEGSPTAPLAVWASGEGHSSGSWAWYYRTRPATPAQYAEPLKKLRRQYAPEYVIQVCKRISLRP